MRGLPPAEPAIEAYLDAVAERLVGPRAPRRAILDELRDGLYEAAAAHLRRGVPAAQAVSVALREFGSPAALAAGFAGELAIVRARRITLAYLATGPLIGLSWLSVIAPTWWWQRDPVTLLHAIPVLPLIAVAAVAGILVLAFTGPAGARLRIAERHGLTRRARRHRRRVTRGRDHAGHRSPPRAGSHSDRCGSGRHGQHCPTDHQRHGHRALRAQPPHPRPRLLRIGAPGAVVCRQTSVL